jgi:hypothetical protein
VNSVAIYDWINGQLQFYSQVSCVKCTGACWVGDDCFVIVGKQYILFWKFDGKNANPQLGDFTNDKGKGGDF